MSDEERFTEAEWRRRSARRECATHGHSWVTVDQAGIPIRMHCERDCGLPAYVVTPEGSCS